MNKKSIKNTGLNGFLWCAKLRVACIHLLISSFIAGFVVVNILPLWYPSIYRDVAGGWNLLFLLLIVDICLGPLVTFIAFNSKKSAAVLRRDLLLIAILQTAALIYGFSVLAEARPVALVFSVDRFTLVSANNVRQEELPHAVLNFQRLSWSGPWVLATRPSTDTEIFESVILATQGFDLAQRPKYWEPFSKQQQQAYLRGKPLLELLNQFSLSTSDFCKNYLTLPCIVDNVRFLPLETRIGSWVVLLGPAGKVLGFAPFDGFQ